MNYVEEIAEKLRERLPDCPPGLIPFYVLLVLSLGEDTTGEDVHDAWSVWCNPGRPDHKSLVPYDQLTPEVQALDEPPRRAIHEVTAQVRTVGW